MPPKKIGVGNQDYMIHVYLLFLTANYVHCCVPLTDTCKLRNPAVMRLIWLYLYSYLLFSSSAPKKKRKSQKVDPPKPIEYSRSISGKDS